MRREEDPGTASRKAKGLSAVFRRMKEADGTPDSPWNGFAFRLFRCRMGGKQEPVIDDAPLRGAGVPYVMLCNHESFEDFYYISRMAHPRKPCYMVNAYYTFLPGLRTLAKHIGALPKKLFTQEPSTGIAMLRTVRRGIPLVVFPEGRLSADGRTNRIAESGAALYRALQADLVLTRIDGAYYAHPKWRDRMYRSDIRVTVRRVLRAQELREMSAAELERVITETLYNDASERTDAAYPQKDKAKGLERLLYRCAACGALYRTRGTGNELVCGACGRRFRLDDSYHFTEWPGSIPGYYDEIRRMEAEELDSLALRVPVRTKICGSGKGRTRRERGVCELTAEAFRYRSGTGGFTIPTAELPALAFSCGKEFELYYEDRLHFFYPEEHPCQVARWSLAVDLLAERRKNGALRIPPRAAGQEEPSAEVTASTGP